jgi:hypothetical protein
LAGVFVWKPPASIYSIDSVPSEVQLGDLSYFIFRSRTSSRHSSAAFESALADSSSRVWSAQPVRGAAIRALRKTIAANLAFMDDPNSSLGTPICFTALGLRRNYSWPVLCFSGSKSSLGSHSSANRLPRRISEGLMSFSTSVRGLTPPKRRKNSSGKFGWARAIHL